MINYDYFFNNKNRYIELIQNILALEMPGIELSEGNKSTAYMTTIFDDHKYIIQVNYKAIPDARTFIAGITHELRHIYQMECVKQMATDLESEQMINLWMQALDAYADSSTKDYDLNLLELDANAFTKRMLSLIFDDDSFQVRTQETSLFKEVYKYICNCFEKEDIESCLSFSDNF